MAGVLDALASHVTNMLAEMAREEVAMLVGVSSGIDDLSVKLGDLKSLLADADRRNITDECVRGWVVELKHAMYHATDVLDLCQLKVMEQGPSKNIGCLNPLLFCMRNPRHAHDIGSRIKTLNEKLDSICKRGGSFNFIRLEAYHDQNTSRPHPISRKTDPLLERSGAVGDKIAQDTKLLVDMIVKEVAVDKIESIMVVAIVGVGGIGKTTLAKNVFNDLSIQGKFGKKIWLSITKDFSEGELLRTAITAANGDLPRGGVDDKALLVPALADAIKDKKIFLVLDDMWSINEWNNLLKSPFSHGALGSRVLITTRHATIARGMKAVHPYHHIDKLGSQDAWSLLKKQVLTNEETEPDIDKLKDIGLKIIEKCDGLPLAIKVMGGVLCQREKDRGNWERVLSDAIWSVAQMPEELNNAIYVSYEDLSPYLKRCFLHFSLKPKNKRLSVDLIVGMWIAEGFVHGNTDFVDELGRQYYNELVIRNLVEPDPTYPGQFVGNMHDIVRSFSQFMSNDEALVVHDGEADNSRLTSHKFLRLSIETKGVGSNGFQWRSLHGQTSLRTLMLTGNYNIRLGDSLIRFSSLRCLHIESTDFTALAESLHQLKHLRYLTVRCTSISRLPENIHEMKFLQHISLYYCGSFVQLPDNIVKLSLLRYLDIECTRVTRMPRGFCALTNMRVLYGFQAHMDGDWCSLEDLGPLLLLRGLGLEGLENVSATKFASKAMLGKKVYLTLLALCCSNSSRLDNVLLEEEQQRIEEVFDELRPLPCLEDLHIRGYFGRRLPIWIMSTTTTPLQNLRVLIMSDLACCTQLPDGLCHLPCLEFIQLSRAPAIKSVGSEFVQSGNYHHHGSSQAVASFPRLRRMDFWGMVEWEEWEWEDEVKAMLALEELSISNCKLRRIPPGLSFHAMSLKKLTLWSVKGLSSLENLAFVVEVDLYDIPSLTRMSNFPKLQKLDINLCPKLESLQEINALKRLVLIVFYSEKQLPLYLKTVNPSHLLLDCGLYLLASLSLGKSGPEWEKFSHIQRVDAYSDDDGIEKKWHLFYTSEPYSMETNIVLQEWSESKEMSSGDEDEDKVDSSQDNNEDESMGNDLKE